MQGNERRRRVGWVVGLAGALGVAVLLFGVPLGTALSVGVLLVCPLLMHGMHGHGASGGHEGGASPAARADRQEAGSTRFIPWD